MRTAIDRFKDAVDQGLIPSTEVTPGSEGYPATLQKLVDGVSAAGDASGRKLKFLRRVPLDPMTGKRRVGDARLPGPGPTARSWGGQNVFDVYSKSEGEGLDGTKFRDW